MPRTGLSKEEMDSQIGLKLPIPISEISDYDLSAPFVSERGVVGE